MMIRLDDAVSTASPAELERLGEEIAELAADLHAVTYRLLTRLHEFDARDGWGPGFLSCAHWLSWRTGIAPGAAREKVRVARALAELPQLAAAMARGELSYAKVRALTRIATPATEEELLELARHATAAQVERVVRAWRRVDRLAEAEAERVRHEARQLTIRVDEDGSYVVRGRLDPEVGALLERALESAATELYDEQRPGMTARGDAAAEPALPTAPQRRADAMGLLIELALSSRELERRTAAAVPKPLRPAARVEVVLHVDAEVLPATADSGQAALAGGVRVSAERSDRAMPVREVIWM